MTNYEASAILKQYCASDDLLSCLERVREQMEGWEGQSIARTDVRVAYYTLMAGFTAMMG